MPIEIDIRHNIPEVRRDLGRLSRHLRDKAMVRALNRGVAKARTDSVRAVSKDTGLRVGVVRGETRVRRANKNRLVASLTFFGDRLNLIAFGARETKRGVSSAPWKKRRVFPGTFIGAGRRGGDQVFKRKGQKSHPIEGLYGPGIADSFDGKGIPVAVASGNEAVAREFRRQVGLFRSRTARSGPRAAGSGASR